MAPDETELQRQVSRALNVLFAGHRANGPAHSPVHPILSVVRAHGNDGGAGELPAIKLPVASCQHTREQELLWYITRNQNSYLIDHQRLVSVINRIDPPHPADPRDHVARRNHKTSIDNKQHHQGRDRRHSLLQGARQRTEHAEEHGHGEGADQDEEPKGEETVGSAAKVGHEVKRNVGHDRDG